MFHQLKQLLFLSLILLSNQQQKAQQVNPPVCVAGENCPYGKGTCIASDYCKCEEGFYTFIQSGQPQISCNYEKTSRYKPLIIEFFTLIGGGHFSVGNWWKAFLKFALLTTFLVITFHLYHRFELPRLFIILIQKLGIAILNLPRGGRTTLEKVLDLIRDFVGVVWTLIHFMDLFLYAFGIYTDGNGVPLA